jgi:hypothetical protein
MSEEKYNLDLRYIHKDLACRLSRTTRPVLPAESPGRFLSVSYLPAGAGMKGTKVSLTRRRDDHHQRCTRFESFPSMITTKSAVQSFLCSALHEPPHTCHFIPGSNVQLPSIDHHDMHYPTIVTWQLRVKCTQVVRSAQCDRGTALP